MQFCGKCYVSMIEVMSFSKEKSEKFCHERFYRCSKCKEETNPVPIKVFNTVFGESLHIAMKKQKYL